MILQPAFHIPQRPVISHHLTSTPAIAILIIIQRLTVILSLTVILTVILIQNHEYIILNLKYHICVPWLIFPIAQACLCLLPLPPHYPLHYLLPNLILLSIPCQPKYHHCLPFLQLNFTMIQFFSNKFPILRLTWNS